MTVISAQSTIADPANGRTRPRVLFLSDHLGHPNGATHGSTTYFLHALPALQRRVDLTVCFLRERHPAAARLEAAGVRPRFLGRGKWDPRALRDLLHIVRSKHVELVHAAGMKGILFGRLAARLSGARSIIHLHDAKPMGTILRSLQRRLAGATDAALVISRAVAAFTERDLAVPAAAIHVLYNPLPVDQYRVGADARTGVRRELEIEPDSPVVGVIGRFAPEKGHAAMLRAAALILHEIPNAVFLLAGDGPLRSECESMARRLGISSSVRFAGHREDVPDVLAAVDVVAVPSVTEGLGYTAMEAMAANRPVAAFAVGGLPEIIRNEENGLLVPPADEAALASAITRLLQDHDLADRLIASGHNRIQHFSIDAHVESLLNLYRGLTARARQVTFG